ncbi:pupal cuticle protein 36-like isoform X2 [Thrips palmi]|uniref:Pupal cuticle protein 36-like isoform X2 n=1 Tax=Thrips palmi TaxID=161013 RepID=A0A6P8ZXD0_THRPL|nr:pupal cuticle protein 36-like isoform X2 [Thrips palmi]
MNRIVLVLSLAAVALAQHHAQLQGHHAALGLSAGLHAPKEATEGVVSTSWTDARLQPAGRSAWTASAGAAGLSGLAMEAKLAPAARAAWSHDAHLNADALRADQILEQQYEMQQPGGYQYSYKTSNGIEAVERAALKAEDAEQVEGTYSWVAPSGEKFSVEYVADETGYHAKGAHIPEIPVAIARSLEWNAAHPEEDSTAGMWEGAERASAGRAAWVSKHSANVPAWESAAKIESARNGFASGRSAWNADAASGFAGNAASKTTKYTETRTLVNPAVATYTASGLAPAARSAWASDSASHGFTGTGFTGTGATQITKITETKPAFTTYTASGLAPAARSAWASDSAAHGFTGTGFTGTGATQITKITETKPAFTTYTASGLAPAARSAWASDATATGFTGTGLTGATQITKITETKPAFTTYTAPALTGSF